RQRRKPRQRRHWRRRKPRQRRHWRQKLPRKPGSRRRRKPRRPRTRSRRRPPPQRRRNLQPHRRPLRLSRPSQRRRRRGPPRQSPNGPVASHRQRSDCASKHRDPFRRRLRPGRLRLPQPRRPRSHPGRPVRQERPNRSLRPYRHGRQRHPDAPPPPITRTITLAEGMTVKDLAEKIEVKAKEVLKKLMEKRMVLTINTTLDTETATMIAREFGADVKMRTFEEEMVVLESEVIDPGDLVPRAPVVTVLGHVDHGKTTLLDAIRETRVAEQEAGGITQHIGAYAAEIDGRRIVFLDTPGHEAFTMMRARGASVTDVVVLVVAADDGVMPQTQEAIDHARVADVPILVAINKIDKSDANPERVKQELAERELTPEDWGGQTVMVPVSAKKRDNLDTLLEMILLVTELGEHKANPKRMATGAVLEAKVDRGRGPVATILVQDGTLHVGDNFIVGTHVGRVRALIDDRGQPLKEAEPSSPVEVLGLTGLPQPGDALQVVADAAKARQIALLRQNQAKEKALVSRGTRVTLESLQQQLAEGEAKELPIIIKADVQGSAEVLAESLAKLGDERVKIRIIHTGVGAISEWDVLLASTSNAIIIGFNVRPDRNAAGVAEREGVDIRKHSVIYNVTDELKKAMTGLLEPTTRERQLGLAEVREVFKVPKIGLAAGCIVTDGSITRAGDAQARLVRDGVIVHEGRIGSLRRFKDDVNEVKTGIECGITFERFSDIKTGDVIEAFTVEKVATV
ncbi:Translation initiation factor IF-2, partial [Geodia barretti]